MAAEWNIPVAAGRLAAAERNTHAAAGRLAAEQHTHLLPLNFTADVAAVVRLTAELQQQNNIFPLLLQGGWQLKSILPVAAAAAVAGRLAAKRRGRGLSRRRLAAGSSSWPPGPAGRPTGWCPGPPGCSPAPPPTKMDEGKRKSSLLATTQCNRLDGVQDPRVARQLHHLQMDEGKESRLCFQQYSLTEDAGIWKDSQRRQEC